MKLERKQRGLIFVCSLLLYGALTLEHVTTDVNIHAFGRSSSANKTKYKHALMLWAVPPALAFALFLTFEATASRRPSE